MTPDNGRCSGRWVVVPKSESRPAQLRPSGRPTGWVYELLLFLLAVLTAAVTFGLQLSGSFKQAPAWLPILLYPVVVVLAVATGV